jgi:hypothetical protein
MYKTISKSIYHGKRQGRSTMHPARRRARYRRRRSPRRGGSERGRPRGPGSCRARRAASDAMTYDDYDECDEDDEASCMTPLTLPRAAGGAPSHALNADFSADLKLNMFEGACDRRCYLARLDCGRH